MLNQPAMLALLSRAPSPCVLRRHKFKGTRPAILFTVNPYWGPSHHPTALGWLCPPGLRSKALCPGWGWGPTLMLCAPHGLDTLYPCPSRKAQGMALPGSPAQAWQSHSRDPEAQQPRMGPP